MKKTMRYLFLQVGLLMSTTVSAYKIETVNVSNGSVIPITYYDGESHNVTVNDTDIPAHKTVTMTVTPGDGYYLSSLVYEEVTSLDNALARRRAPDIKPVHYITIPTNNSTYLAAHFGGSYSFEMPENNVIITATFVQCTSINDGKVYWDSWDGTSALPQSKVYDGAAHTLKVRVGDTELTKDRHYTTTAYTQTNVGSITPSITGIGEYCGSISPTTLSITQQPLTITAKAQTISYGSSIQTGISQVTTEGLVAGDALTNITLTPSTSDVTTTGTITPSGADTTKGLSNYSVTYNTGILTIQAFDLSAVVLSDEMLDIDLDQDNFNYISGTSQQAQVTSIKYKNTSLVHGTSYTYDYAKLGVYTGSIGYGNEANPETPVDYTTPDIYTIVITFCGNYTGTKTVKYQIRPEVTVNNTDFKWRTFYEPLYNMKVPATGFTAHTVRDVNVNAVELDDRQHIKAGIPMLLFRTGTKDKFKFYPELVEPTDAGVNGWTGLKNYFKNSTGLNLDAEANVQNETKKIWILKDDVFVRTKTGTIAEGKCYLELASDAYPSLSRQLTLGSNTTSIEQPVRVVTNSGNDVWYTLDGRKMQGMPTQKGIYITNGKKIIIK